MQIGQRLRELREAKKFSQGEIEQRTGLLRCYVSRVENGHTVPSIETLEKFARALEVPTYQLFVGAEEHPDPVIRSIRETATRTSFGKNLRERRYMIQLWRLFEKMHKTNRALLLVLAQAMADRKQ